VNWEAIAEGAMPDNIAFARLPEDEQLETIRAGLRRAEDHQRSAPEKCYKIADVALHLLDAHGVADPVRRMECGLALAISAQALGRPAEAKLQYDKLLAAPTAADTRHVRVTALFGLASLLYKEDPERAAQLYAEARRVALEAGDSANAANAAISLGSLQRRAGRGDDARFTYEEAILEMRTAGTPDAHEQATLARLCGNLANLLTDDLGCHAEAIDYYDEAIRLFELAGERENAAQRFFHLVSTNLAAGRHRTAFDMMAAGTQRVQDAPEAFRGMLEEVGWLAGAPDDIERWERWLDRFESESSQPLDPQTSAALVAARVVAHSRMGSNVEAIALARRDALRVLSPSPLRNELGVVVSELASTFGCTGICWNLAWLFDERSEEFTAAVESAYHHENATVWLLEQAKSVEAGRVTEQEIEHLLAHGPIPYGLGSADDELLEWIGPVAPRTREIYARLRAGYPNADETKRAFQVAFDAWNANDPPERSAQLLGTCIYWADLIGDPRPSIECRLYLVACLDLQPVTRERYNEALHLLEIAGQLAERLPSAKLRVHRGRANVLTQCRFGDEATRLGEAITEARQALDIAEAHGLTRWIPSAALALGNALAEHPYASEAEFFEAKTVLEKGLAANEPSGDEFMQSSLQNTLGMVLFEIGEESDSVERLLEAKEAFLAAHAGRKHLGDDERELTTLGNLLGALARIYQLTADESVMSDIHAATGRILELHRQNPAAPRLGIALMTAALALDKIKDPAALEVGSAAITVLRASGPLRALAGCLSNVARMHLDAGNVREARRLATEAIVVGDDLRRQGGDSRYRAELTATFEDAHHILDGAMEKLGAAPADRWREVERGTARTIVENMSSRYSEELPDHDAVRAVLRAGLPSDTVILHLFRTYRNDLAAFLITSSPHLEVRVARHRWPLLAFAQDTGGGIVGRKLRLSRFMPEHGDQFTFQLSRLGSGLLAPVLSELSDRVTRIVVVDSIFGGDAPWQAVPVRSGIPLGVRFEVVQVPSASVLARLLSVPDRPIAKAAFVACDAKGSLRRHIDECRHAFRAADIPEKVVLTDTSRPVVKSTIRDVLDDVDLFHFAGHSAIVHGSPESSGLELSDGVLTVPELESALQRSAPMLVFLSSCESGRADQRLLDAPTMSSVFLQAGTRSVVSAAWPVQDQVAAATARLFYQNLAREGQLGALRHAQGELRTMLTGVEWASFGFQGWPAG
jgi:tetratricopeptide (TPR) repeat protein